LVDGTEAQVIAGVDDHSRFIDLCSELIQDPNPAPRSSSRGWSRGHRTRDRCG
jgi:hypothetical protein